MDSRYQVKPLPHIGTVVDTHIQPFFLKFCINGSRPLLPPVFQRFRLMPVCCMDSVKHIIAVFIPDSVSIFIKKIFPTLFLSPCAIRVQRAHGCHHMKMRVRDAAVLFLRAVKSKVGNHAFCHKLLLYELPRQLHVFFQRQFILHGNIKGIGKLCFWMFLAVLHSIPEGRPVKIYFRRMGRQHDFRSDHAALFGVVADFSIVAAVKTLPGSIGCAGNGALTGAALDLCD